MAAPFFDRRRVNGPEESFPPIFDDEGDLHSVVATGKRSGDRGKKDLRPICVSLGSVHSERERA
jgi:exosome complex component MTR3